MTFHDMIKIIEDQDKFEKVWDATRTLAADYRFFNVAHDRFLPAAKEYRDYLKGVNGADKQSATFKSLRGRLGACSRLHYQAQKETFVRLISLVSPISVPEVLVESAWNKFKQAERGWMASGRSR